MTEPPLPELADLYREVDASTHLLDARHGDRLRCARGCSSCCVDDLRVFEIEAEYIRRALADWLETALPHPSGGCAFLGSAGECRIYPHRPYVCRTQGYPLRWFDEDPEGGTVELRDICPLNEEGGDAVELLPSEACWTIGPAESRLAGLQARWRGNAARVELRSLFHRELPGDPSRAFDV